jgi:hypothetical protein
VNILKNTNKPNRLHGTAALALWNLLRRAWDKDFLACQRWGGPINLWVSRDVLLAVDLEDL